MKTGEVIRVRKYKTNPFLFHYGIVLNEIAPDDSISQFILHNPFGGYPSKTTSVDFFKDRDFEKSFGILAAADPVILMEKFNRVKNKKYNLLTFNCEDFVNYMIERNCISLENCFLRGKISFWASVLGLTASVIYITRVLLKKSK